MAAVVPAEAPAANIKRKWSAHAIVAAVIAVALLALPSAAAAHDGFSDVSDDSTHSANIHTLDHAGTFDATFCGVWMFCPGAPLSRAHMAVWLVRVLDGSDPAPVAGTRFSDVDRYHPHAAFIERFAELGVTRGCETDPLRYCPDENVSRAQMASFLTRAFDLEPAESAGFVDVTSGGTHSANIDALAASGITHGCDTDPLRYCPWDDVQRAQMASFLVRASHATASGAVSSPLERCATDWYGAGRVSALVGNTDNGFYEPIVQGGADSCERIMAWWDQVRQAEADRIAQRQYPCEYAAAYNYWPRDEVQINGPAMFVGCWPRILMPGNEDNTGKRADPDEEALRLWNREGFWINPPNDPPMVEALYDCYRDALQGPPPGWAPAEATGEWPTVNFCTRVLDNYGNPVRSLGVTSECAAEQYAGTISERKARGFVGEQLRTTDGTGFFTGYAGDWSWSNCSTNASRLLLGGLDTYRERCEAVVDASVNHNTIEMGAAAGLGRGQLGTARVVEVVKAMFCDGDKQAIRDHGHAYQDFVPHWQDPYGDFVAAWLPAEGAVCFEAAILVAAQKAVRGGWTRVKYC